MQQQKYQLREMELHHGTQRIHILLGLRTVTFVRFSYVEVTITVLMQAHATSILLAGIDTVGAVSVCVSQYSSNVIYKQI